MKTLQDRHIYPALEDVCIVVLREASTWESVPKCNSAEYETLLVYIAA